MNNREIDALVAEKVMGWKLFTATKETTAISNGSRVSSGTWIDSGGRHEWGPDVVKIPAYSKNIEFAWQVVEKIKDDTGYFELKTQPEGYKFEFSTFDSSGVGIADTAPMAICLAALKAIGVTQ